MINWEQDFVLSNLVWNHTRDETNRTPTTRLSHFVKLITHMITDQIGLHSVMLPLFIWVFDLVAVMK